MFISPDRNRMFTIFTINICTARVFTLKNKCRHWRLRALMLLTHPDRNLSEHIRIFRKKIDGPMARYLKSEISVQNPSRFRKKKIGP